MAGILNRKSPSLSPSPSPSPSPSEIETVISGIFVSAAALQSKQTANLADCLLIDNGTFDLPTKGKGNGEAK